MKAQYIFIKKQDSNLNTNKSKKLFQSIFNQIFQNTTLNTFEIHHDNINDTILYKSSASDSDVYYLELSHESSPSNDAILLNIANKMLISGRHRKDFYIINSYDEPSEYCCAKLAPRFGKFERLMRAFIYTSLTKNLGFKWFETTFTKELKNALKGKGNISDADLIERGLHEMNFSQLYDYLFKEYSYCSAESVIYEQLLTQDLYSIDKIKLINIINQCKKENLWDRFFNNTTEFDLKGPLCNIREYRNKVAHNKYITTSDYNTCTNSLRKINTILTSAINKLNNNIYTEIHLLDSVMSFSALFTEILKNNYDFVSSIQRNFSLLGKTLINTLKPIVNIDNSSFFEFNKFITTLQSTMPKIEIPDFYRLPSIPKFPDILNSNNANLDENQIDTPSIEDHPKNNSNSDNDDKEEE